MEQIIIFVPRLLCNFVMILRGVYIWLIFILASGVIKTQDVPWHCGLIPDSSGSRYFINEIPEEIEIVYQKNSISTKALRKADVVIPIIFHHVKKAGNAPIDPAIIVKLVEGLNAMYANESPFERPAGVRTGIRFCLASRLPDGLPTDGLEIHDSPYHAIHNMEDYNALTNVLAVNPTDYVNIYLCDTIIRNRQYVRGFATLPGSQHGRFFEGIAMKTPIVVGSISDVYLLAHEMGHYLGLHHTFEQGCKNDNCLQDGDKVCDTPPVKSPAFYPCSFTVNTCDTDGDDTDNRNPFRPVNQGGKGDVSDDNNLMDYAGCRDRFTQGQADRMTFFIENVRNALLQSKACSPPCVDAPVAQIEIQKNVFSAGDTIQITNLSTGSGEYHWYLNGVLIHTGFNPPNLSPIEVGLHALTLEIHPNDSLCNKVTSSLDFEVNCPLEPHFTYYVNGDVVYVKRNSTTSDSFRFIVYLGNQVIASSQNEVDSFKIPVGGYRLCLEEYEDFCFKKTCFPLHIVVFGEEQCQNEYDDDGDGFVDAFDTDCPCDSVKFEANCHTDCEYIPDTFLPVKMKLKWQSDFVSDLQSFNNKYESCSPLLLVDPVQNAIIIKSMNWVDPSEDSTDFAIKRLDLKTGGDLARDVVNKRNRTGTGAMAIGDIDRDGRTDIFVYYVETENGTWFQVLARINDNGELVWKNRYVNNVQYQFLKLADFNGDGLVELYSGDKIYNAETGTLLCEGSFGKGCWYLHSGSPCFYENSVAQDITDAPGLELIAGNTIYEVVLNNLDGLSGNTMTTVLAPTQVPDGLTAVADMDGDGHLDVIVLKTAYTQVEERSLSIWNPQNGGTLLAKMNFAIEFGGVPTVADLDNDCIPEIMVNLENKLLILKYLASGTILQWRQILLKDDSGILSATAFDLNQDGFKEILIRDEEHLRIIDPLNNLVLDSFSIKSKTFIESPVVTDVDGDGHAEILIDGFLPEEKDRYRVFCLESANIPWAPSRVVWNQHGYHVTNVNDDLTIPRHPQEVVKKFNTASCARQTCPDVYNNYMVQATHRTQEGCEPFPALDVTLHAQGFTCAENSIEVVLTLEDISKNRIQQDSVTISTYVRIPDLTNTPFQSNVYPFSSQFRAGGKDTIRLTINNLPAGTKTLLFRINDPGLGTAFSSLKGLTSTLECNYENNTALLDVNLDSLALDLGPDIIKCKHDVITLQTNQVFESYQWSDFSNGSTLTVSDPGLYILNARDVCHRLYTDSIYVNVDSASIIDKMPDVEKCFHEDISIELQGDLDWVQWQPSDMVSCDTCYIVSISGQEDVELYVLASKNGCLDVDTIQVNVKIPDYYLDEITICQGDSIDFFGQYITLPGDYVYHSVECDSTVLWTLHTLKPDSNYIDFQLCRGDSIHVDNTWYHDEVQEIISLQNQYGCDSTVFLDITLIDTVFNQYTEKICFGDSILFGNEYYKESGIYEFMTLSTAGCPVIESVVLDVVQHDEKTLSETICKGDSLNFNGNWLFTSGIYSDTLQDNSGCDSIVVLFLEVSDELTRYDTIQSCIGHPVWVIDQFVEESGDYVHIMDGEPCDLFVYTNVKFFEPTSSNSSAVLCPGDSLFVGGQWVKEAGVYEENLMNLNGCDSTHIVTIQKISIHGQVTEEVDCSLGVTYIEIPDENGWNHIPEASFFEFNQDTTLQLFWVHPEGCFDTTYLYLPKISSESELPVLPDTVLYLTNTNLLSIELDPNTWSLKWTPGNNVICDTCFHLHLIANENTDLILSLMHASGCAYQRQIFIKKVEDEIFIPNIFLPGSTGDNKVWKMNWPQNLQFNQLSIYDRWGDRVYHSTESHSLEWDGTFYQRPLQHGVYVVFIEYIDFFGTTKILTKDITLIR